MTEHLFDLSKEKIFVVIPMYNASPYIQDVIRGIPQWIDHIIVVDDASIDDSIQKIQQFADERVELMKHPINQGVGGAMLTGYNRAVELGARILVKMDSDNQMPPEYLPDLVYPILEHKADFVKGNRFFHLSEITRMPLMRRIGNLGLSFLSKIASGYWNIFDPANGYIAMTTDVFTELDKGRLHKRFFFETSLLIQLNLTRAVVSEVAIPARYTGEISSLSIFKTLCEFPILLLRGCLHRLWIQYFVLDFSVGSLFMIVGPLLCLFGSVWGLSAWMRSSITNTPATTGTVMISVVPLILGFQLLLQAIVYDVQNIPRVIRSRQVIHRPPNL